MTRVIFQAGPELLTPEILTAAVSANLRRLRTRGIFVANMAFKQILDVRGQYMSVLAGGGSSGELAGIAGRLAEVNREMRAAATAVGCDTIVMLQDEGLCPSGSRMDGLCPFVGTALPALLAGFEADEIILVLHRAPSGVTGPEGADLAEDRQIELCRRMQKGLTHGQFVVRPGVGVVGSGPLVDTFLRDLGINPSEMRLPVLPGAMPCRPGTDRPEAFSILRPDRALTIFFMIEPGPLELQAHLLVSSLRLNCLDPARLVGYCRSGLLDGLHPETLAFMDRCEVEIRPIVNDFADGYPAGNKLVAAAAVADGGGDWGLFLDTDTLLMRPSHFLDETVAGRVSLCLDTVNGWSADPRAWELLFGTAGTAVPAPVRLLSGQVSIPIYNAGMVLFPLAGGEDGRGFGRYWHDLSRRLDAIPDLPKTRPWLDTIALAAAALSWGGMRLLSPDWNCTTRMAGPQTRLLHYHGLRQLAEFGWVAAVDALLAASVSPHDSLEQAVRYHQQEMGRDGDLWRRAMLYGTTRPSLGAKPGACTTMTDLPG